MLLQLLLVLLASSLVKSLAINVNIFRDEITKEVSLTTCDVNACDAICKTFGYKYGVCSDGQCMCFYYGRSKHHTKEVRSLDCDDSTCNAWCIGSGSTGGFCAADSCYCYTFKPLREHHTKEVRSQDDCDDTICNAWCIGSGSTGGFCAGDFCYCYTFKPLRELKPKVSYSLADCNFQACGRVCLKLGLPGGACVGDRCDCDIFKPLQELLRLIVPKKSIEHENSGKHQKIIKYNDVPKKRLPYDFKSCNDHCNESNYIGGIFIGYRCNCY